MEGLNSFPHRALVHHVRWCEESTFCVGCYSRTVCGVTRRNPKSRRRQSGQTTQNSIWYKRRSFELGKAHSKGDGKPRFRMCHGNAVQFLACQKELEMHCAWRWLCHFGTRVRAEEVSPGVESQVDDRRAWNLWATRVQALGNIGNRARDASSEPHLEVDEGISYETDPGHVDTVVKTLGVTKPVTTPLAREPPNDVCVKDKLYCRTRRRPYNRSCTMRGLDILPRIVQTFKESPENLLKERRHRRKDT